jgi:hypothetical protein
MASVSDHGSLRTISRSNSTSSHGHISSLQEASTLLSPGQLHRDSLVQEQDIPATIEHVEDESKTQRSLFPIPAPSNPNSTREGKDVRPISPRRETHWKTVGMILGFLFTGQSAHAQGSTPLTLRSLFFCPRTLPACQKLGREPY